MKRSTLTLALLSVLTFSTTGQAPNITYDAGPHTFYTGKDISELVPANTGGAPTKNTFISRVLESGTFGSNVSGIAFSPDYSSLYTVLQQKYVIKKVTLSTSAIEDFAGKFGTSGYLDGNGSSALFASTSQSYIPSGVAVHPVTGELYFADTNNHRIRKISTSGEVTTYAGTGEAATIDGPSETAAFNFPYDLAFDSEGGLYVVQSSKLRKITEDGVYTIHASVPVNSYGIAIDNNAGLVYLSERAHRINVVNLVDGTLVTFVGNGTAGSTDGIGTAALLNTPRGMIVDKDGNLYFADYGNHTIRKATPDGVVTTIAGLVGQAGQTDGVAAVAKFNGPSNLAFDKDGNIFITVTGTQNIKKLTFNNPPFSIKPKLPDGLNFDVNTGKISGKPLVESEPTDYLIVAHNATGISSVTVNITVRNSTSVFSPVNDTDLLRVNHDKDANMLSIKGKIREGATAFLSDSSGKKMLDVKLIPGDVNTLFIPKDYSGIYILCVKNGNHLSNHKIIL